MHMGITIKQQLTIYALLKDNQEFVISAINI